MTADPKAALRDRARVVLWGVALVAGVQAAATYLAQNHTGAVIAQVVLAELGTGYLGVAWSDPLAPMPTTQDIARRALRGVLLGGAAAVVLVGASVMFHAATLEPGTFGVAPLIVGLLVSALTAARDELLLRGLVLRALGPQSHTPWRLLACGAAGLLFRLGVEPSASKASLAFAFFGATALGALWLRDRGAWLAVGANAMFMFMTGPLAHGAWLDVRTAADIDSSFAAVGCSVACAASAVAWSTFARRPSTDDRMPS